MNQNEPIESPADLTVFWSWYNQQVLALAIYPGQGSATGLVYTALGLAGEVGEVCDQVKKILRDDGNAFTEVRLTKIAGELGDALWYIAASAREIGADLQNLADACASMSELADGPMETIPGFGTPTAAAACALTLDDAVGKFSRKVVDWLSFEGHPGEQPRVTELLIVFGMWLMAVDSLALNPRDVAITNVQKLFSRKARGVLSGDGSAR